jgi:uncharacterized membrane protein YjjP (DUF1212 family)
MANPDKILTLATQAGKSLLESGAETYRVEDTICRICKSLHMEEAESICLPTGIYVTAMMDGKSYTKIARIPQRSTNLHRVDQLNQLSRDAASLNEHEFEKKLNEIIHETPYTNLTDLLFAGLSALGFVLVFGGVFTDALIAFLIGILVRLLDKTLGKLQINSFFSVAISAATLTILALMASYFHMTVSADTVIIGTIMLLVPGLAITNAVRDSIAGDLISGLARGAEALLIAVAVALGNGLGMMIWIWMGGIIG